MSDLIAKDVYASYVVNQDAGNMALSGFVLTDEDKDRILYLLEHPEEENTILQELIDKHRVD